MRITTTKVSAPPPPCTCPCTPFASQHAAAAHHEVPPYSPNALRSVYHTRALEVHRMTLLAPSPLPADTAPSTSDPSPCPAHATADMDIFLSHDWPQGVYRHGNTARLLAQKPYFAEEVARNDLGSPPLQTLLAALQPAFWFAAHLHVQFAAVVPGSRGGVTRFLALDKVIPNR